MTRQPFDEFSKQLFEALLTPYGRVSVDRTVPGESRRIDIYLVVRQGDVGLVELEGTAYLQSVYGMPSMWSLKSP
jgi:hypothetical protein